VSHDHPQSEMIGLCHGVVSCKQCPDSIPSLLRDEDQNLPQPGYVGSDYWATGVLLIGQNPGVVTERFRAQNSRYAHLLKNVRDSPNSETYNKLSAYLREIIPTWPVSGNYFPLAECGLTFDDIAYFNLVRCRTVGNKSVPKSMTSNCVAKHFADWMDTLRPRVVICIGKWAYDKITPHESMNDQIEVEYINRQRSLSLSERQANRERVVSLVRKALSETDESGLQM